MIVLRSTMEAAIETERERGDQRLLDLTRQYGEAMRNVLALQQQLSAWITNEPGNITPEQMAAMFWQQDDRWQAAFFGALQDVAQAHADALPPARPNEYRGCIGVPPGEGQWYWMAQHLDQSGFETIEAMFDHAKYAREREQAA